MVRLFAPPFQPRYKAQTQRRIKPGFRAAVCNLLEETGYSWCLLNGLLMSLLKIHKHPQCLNIFCTSKGFQVLSSGYNLQLQAWGSSEGMD